MEDLEKKLRSIDFSRFSDLKGRLAQELFHQEDNTLPICSLSDSDLEFVNAARGLPCPDKDKKAD